MKKITYVLDARGNVMFRIPLRGCMLDTQFRGGRLRFRELSTSREGYVDMQGIVVFTATSASPLQPTMTAPEGHTSAIDGTAADVRSQQSVAKVSRKEVRLPAVDNSPFYAEASKIISGKLEETDATRRRQILNYCEHLRTAYTTKDIDFLRQVFSDDALIIVGNVVRQSKEEAKVGADSRVSYALHTKADYL